MKVLVLHNENDLSNIENITNKLDDVNVKCRRLVDNSSIIQLMNLADKIIIFFNRTSEEMIMPSSRLFNNFVRNRNKVVMISNFKHMNSFNRIFNYIVSMDYNDVSNSSKLIKVIKSFFVDSNVYVENINKNIELKDKVKSKKDFYKLSKNMFIISLYIFIVISYLKVFGFSFIIFNFNLYDISKTCLVISILLFMYPLINRLINYENNTNNKEVKYSDKLKDLFFEEVTVEANKKNEYEENALNRMLYNLRAIDEYYIWSQKQSKGAFWLSIVLIILGIIVIVGCIICSIFFELDFILSLIGTTGGVIIEFIAGTALVIYKSSLSQLNHYHHSLHEDERFLSSVNLVSSLSKQEDKDEVIKKIIDSELNLNLVEIGNCKIGNIDERN